MSASVLVLDDDQFMRASLEDILSAHFDVTPFSEGEKAVAALTSNRFDVAITDLKMPGMTGLEFLAAAIEKDPGLPVIVITAHGTIETAVEAMKRGAYDYIRKPFGADELEHLVRRAVDHRRLGRENEVLRGELRRVSDRPLLGDSEAMERVRDRIAAVANSDATILVRAETGSGKELVSRAIHYASQRADRPFLCVNCAALSAGLLESELFGHEKGAFTGADQSRTGRFEMADGGTLLLDEVSEIDPNLQAKLLRVLQEKEFERVGSSKTRKADVRVVATTNRKLEEEVREGRFREDLYFRLNIVPIEVPPLRERKEDIPLLSGHFKEQAERRAGRSARPFSEASRAALLAYHWPGNVRELENLIERAVLLSTGPEIVVDGLQDASPVTTQASVEGLTGMSLERIERAVIEETLKQFDGHQKKTAETLGIGVRTLRDKIKKWDLAFGRRARARAASAS
ncbi:MAG: sigma-54 dependent transcriptional regulator [Planctomycetota bacterium]